MELSFKIQCHSKKFKKNSHIIHCNKIFVSYRFLKSKYFSKYPRNIIKFSSLVNYYSKNSLPSIIHIKFPKTSQPSSSITKILPNASQIDRTNFEFQNSPIINSQQLSRETFPRIFRVSCQSTASHDLTVSLEEGGRGFDSRPTYDVRPPIDNHLNTMHTWDLVKSLSGILCTLRADVAFRSPSTPVYRSTSHVADTGTRCLNIPASCITTDRSARTCLRSVDCVVV